MKVAIIGRSELLYDTALLLLKHGYTIPLIVTAKEAPEYTKTADDFKKLASSINAKFVSTPKISAPENLGFIRESGEIDIAVSINYISIISGEIIGLFRLGVLNAHGGDLPRYRGNACQAWAIINGEEKIGLCVHKMVGGELDNGDIITREYYPIDINTRIGHVYNWMNNRIPVMMLDAVTKLDSNNSYYLDKPSADPALGLRCYPRCPDDGQIDWKKPNTEILRLINASSEPFSGAYCTYENNIMRIWQAAIFDDSENYLAVPGQVAHINFTEKYVVVITGNGKLRINEVEYEGKRNNPTEFIKSIRKRLK